MKQIITVARIILLVAFSFFTLEVVVCIAGLLDHGTTAPQTAANQTTTPQIDIPRSHLGITLGMMWSEAKQVLAKNGWPNLDEEKDDVHKTIVAKPRYSAETNYVTEEFKGKYARFYIDIFDNRVYSIRLLPKDNQEDIIEALKRKYPFDVKEEEGLLYYSGVGVVPTIERTYHCSNGMTEIRLRDGSNVISYSDVKLQSEKKAYWESAEAKSQKRHEAEVDHQLSDY